VKKPARRRTSSPRTCAAFRFAQEAVSLLRSGSVPPTGDQLALADQAPPTQLTQLDAAITGLQAQTESAQGEPSLS
jgi:hypothetical protein